MSSGSRTSGERCATPQGDHDDAQTFTDRFFGLEVPRNIDGVPDAILDPRETWADQNAYDEKARELTRMFAENFERYADEASQEVIEAGPTVEVEA